MTNMTNVQTAAGQAATVLEQVMEVEPEIAGIVGIFLPQIGLIQPEVLALAPILERALRAVSGGNGGDMMSAVTEVAKHLLPGLANSPILSAPPLPKAE